MIFRGWQKTSLIEYPGKIVSVLWVGGCNWRCPWCYNKDLVLNSEKLPSFKEGEILDFLKTRKKLLDGIIITGGEPTLKKGLQNFIKKVKKLKFLIGIETNGSNPEMLKKMIKEKLLNFVAMDIKAPVDNLQLTTYNSQLTTHNLQPNKYDELTGVKVNLKKIKESIGIIKNSSIDYEFKTTIVPILTKNDIIKIAKFLKGAKKFVLQQFNPKESVLKEEYKKIKPYAESKLKEMQKAAKKFVENTEVRL
ncbi:MAG: pyruvate formate lyase activating enzyme [Parcubacteria group bacterium Athens1014_10]|nr:MAG: pyruvate formate lyase activating enzyme [Parcubacteria group bacterium Athens1014_10]TSD06110.1 MAG: pyruvate formate lyase activating enzyme [Parcubacteria group bacterium Athens0714_12]